MYSYVTLREIKLPKIRKIINDSKEQLKKAKQSSPDMVNNYGFYMIRF